MTNCKVSKITHEGKLSHGIKIETPKGETHVVPVIDVRDGEVERGRINRVLKATSGQSNLLNLHLVQAVDLIMLLIKNKICSY